MATNLTQKKKAEFLSSAPLFAELSDEALLDVAAISEERNFEKGDVLAREGEPGHTMFVIVSGDVWVSIKNKFGEAVELAKRGPGDHLGEMAILSEIPRTATLTALSSVKILQIEKKEFEEILLTQPRTSLGIIRELIRRLDESDVRIKNQSEANKSED